jgi:epoxide hydrolase-like predicted phosphatase
MKIKAGIFDIGGVLLDWSNEPMFQDIATHLGVSRGEVDKAWKKYSIELGNGTITENQFWEKFLKQVQSSKALPDESLFLREFRRLYSPRTEMFDLITQLKRQGYVLAILSNTIEPHVRHMQEMKLVNAFDVVVYSNEVQMSKPDPHIYTLTLKRMGMSPDQTFFIDDIEENVDAACSLGIHGILFKEISQVKNDLKKLGVKVR